MITSVLVMDADSVLRLTYIEEAFTFAFAGVKVFGHLRDTTLRVNNDGATSVEAFGNSTCPSIHDEQEVSFLRSVYHWRIIA